MRAKENSIISGPKLKIVIFSYGKKKFFFTKKGDMAQWPSKYATASRLHLRKKMGRGGRKEEEKEEQKNEEPKYNSA